MNLARASAVLFRVLLLVRPLAAQPSHGHHGRHGNPEDLPAYIAKMEEPSRDEWQRPDKVVSALEIGAGQTVCDIGAGPGYFAVRLGRAVGEGGHVYAVDVEPKILEVLRDRIQSSGLTNITPILALPQDPLLAAAACDLILIVNTFHHFPDGAAYLGTLQRALRAKGRIVNIDFHKKETPVGPPVAHRVARKDFLHAAKASRLNLVREETFLPYQYFLVLEAELKHSSGGRHE